MRLLLLLKRVHTHNRPILFHKLRPFFFVDVLFVVSLEEVQTAAHSLSQSLPQLSPFNRLPPKYTCKNLHVVFESYCYYSYSSLARYPGVIKLGLSLRLSHYLACIFDPASDTIQCLTSNLAPPNPIHCPLVPRPS